MAEPIQGQAFTYYTTLWSGGLPVSNPTITAGDFTLSKDGGVFANMATLPSVEPVSSISVKLSFSATEMDAENILVIWDDPDDTWDTDGILIQTVDEASSGLTAAQVWSYATRTLTMSASEIASLAEGSDIEIRRGDTYSLTITGLGSLVGYTSLWWTGKDDDVSDTGAMFQIKKNASGLSDGLLYVAGDSYATASHGSITILDETAGNIRIDVDEAATKLLPIHAGSYDVQKLISGTVTTVLIADYEVVIDYSRAIT